MIEQKPVHQQKEGKVFNESVISGIVEFAHSKGYDVTATEVRQFIQLQGGEKMSKEFIFKEIISGKGTEAFPQSVPVSRLFRKNALKNLHSPDDLNTLLKLTTPKSWLAMLILAILTLTVITWGFLGSIPVRVHGLGLIQKQGGIIYNVLSKAEGTIKKLSVKTGQEINKGEPIAELYLREKETEKLSAQRSLESINQRYQRENQTTERLISENDKNIDKQNRALEKYQNSLTQQLGYLNNLFTSQKEELKKGYVVLQQVETTRGEIFNTEKVIRDTRNQISLNLTRKVQYKNGLLEKLAQLEQQLINAQENMRKIDVGLETRKVIYSPFNGRITELDIRQGDRVQDNQPIVTIEQAGEDLQLYAYFQASSGKKLSPGMKAGVAPTSVEQSLFGSIIGRVDSVSDLVESRDGLMAIFGNEDLVNQLLTQGPPIQVIITLKKDPDTFSGFKWSSSRGPNFHITSGNMAAVAVTIEEKKPIDFVIPFFKAWEPGG